MPASRYDAILVGGGHNGLVAAFYLARAGLKVLVLERRAVVGGPAATVEYFPGYFGAITNSPGSVEPRIVADMELERHGLKWVKPDPSVIMPFPGGRFFVGWRDQQKLAASITRQYSAKDARAFAEAFAFFDDFARRIKVSLFEPPPTMAELVARLKTPQDETDFATIFLSSIREFVDARFESEDLKTTISMMAGFVGAVAPSTPGAPVALLLRPMSLYSSAVNAFHDPRTQVLRGSTGLPLGGMGSIVRAMEAALRKLGVTIETDAAVARIRIGADGAVRGVALASGRELTAPIVVSNLHPRTTLIDLVERGHVPDELAGRLRAIPTGGAAFKVVLAVDEPPLFAGAPPELATSYASCQIRIAPNMDYLEQVHRDFVAKRLTECPRLLGLIPSMIDPTMAPAGKHLVSFNCWFFPYELAGSDWHTARDVLGERIVRILTEYIPSLRRSIVAKKFFSPIDLEREYGLVGGNYAHIDMTPPHMFGLRPLAGMSDYRTPVRGLYLCGASTWPGGTVTGVPGHNAGHQVLRDLAQTSTASRERA
jgi:phytoene dehydrogenase-like protein